MCCCCVVLLCVVACCCVLLRVACCVLCVVCCVWCVWCVCCVLCVACCVLCVACCVLRVACCVLRVMCVLCSLSSPPVGRSGATTWPGPRRSTAAHVATMSAVVAAFFAVQLQSRAAPLGSMKKNANTQEMGTLGIDACCGGCGGCGGCGCF